MLYVLRRITEANFQICRWARQMRMPQDAAGTPPVMPAALGMPPGAPACWNATWRARNLTAAELQEQVERDDSGHFERCFSIGNNLTIPGAS
jgi:hypothetical protein